MSRTEHFRSERHFALSEDWPSCGKCDTGTGTCPVPAACQRPEPAAPSRQRWNWAAFWRGFIDGLSLGPVRRFIARLSAPDEEDDEPADWRWQSADRVLKVVRLCLVIVFAAAVGGAFVSMVVR